MLIDGLKLTSLSSCAGCAAKLGQDALAEVLKILPSPPSDRRLLVGTATADDAGVYRVDSQLALVQTVDFFTPIVDDPFTYGRIAATNAISDVYAMGGRPLTALNLLGVPADVLAPAQIAAILRGGMAAAKTADCAVLGGHTIRLPEPVYGMAVTGLVAPARIIANTAAAPGDWLVLTKPLGTGIVTTAIKRGLASARLAQKCADLMCVLNRVGAELAERRLVRAGTDITGFGLLGHLANICRGSQVRARLEAEKVPAIAPEVLELIQKDCIPGGSRQNLKTAEVLTDWNGARAEVRHLITDAQTSGGLLLCVRPGNLAKTLATLKRFRTPCAAVIGRIERSSKPEIVIASSSRSPVLVTSLALRRRKRAVLNGRLSRNSMVVAAGKRLRNR